MRTRRRAFGSAWAALLVGLSTFGLGALALISERAGVPVPILRFLFTVGLLGGLLAYSVSALIVEPDRWVFARRSVRGVSVAPALLFLGIALAWAASQFAEASRGAVVAGTFIALFATTLLLGPRLRRIGAATPGRMLQLRFSEREGLPLRFIVGLVASLVLVGLLQRVLGLLTLHIGTELGIGTGFSIVLAALLVFLPGWAGGITTILRLARIGLALGFAAIATAILIGALMPASAGAALPTLTLSADLWTDEMVESARYGFVAALLLPSLTPLLASLSTPMSALRLSGWFAALGLFAVIVMIWTGSAAPTTTDRDVDTLAASAMAPIFVNVAALAALAVGGSLLLFALALCLVDDLVLGFVREDQLVGERHLAWLRLASLIAIVALGASLFMEARIGEMAAMIGPVALPVFLAMAIATIMPTLLWRGTSGVGALAGMAIAGVGQIVLLLIAIEVIPLDPPAGMLDGLVSGLFGMATTVAVSLLVPPGAEARLTAAAMVATGDSSSIDEDAPLSPEPADKRSGSKRGGPVRTAA